MEKIVSLLIWNKITEHKERSDIEPHFDIKGLIISGSRLFQWSCIIRQLLINNFITFS